MSTDVQSSLSKALAFLVRLQAAKIWYRLEHVRDSLLVSIAVPGERWEVEFFEDGHVEVERFISAGAIEDEDTLDNLIATHSDP